MKRLPLSLLLTLALGSLVSTARAQVVYDSLSGTLSTPPAITDLAVVDDYTTSLYNGDLQGKFRLQSFSFVGGPIFAGASTAANSSLRFTFLDQFGGFISTIQVQFATSGSFLRTVDVSSLSLLAGEKGFFQVTSTATTAATIAFTDTAPSVGSNSSAVGNPVPGIRAFSLTAASAPEPATLALLALGGIGLLARRRRR